MLRLDDRRFNRLAAGAVVLRFALLLATFGAGF